MDFMMHKIIAVISSSILLMNSRLMNISKPLVPEVSLVRGFDFLCISLMMKVQSRSEMPYDIAITHYRISVPSEGPVFHLEVRGVKQCLCYEFLRSQEALSVCMPEPFKARAPGAFWRQESKGRRRCAVLGCWVRGMSEEQRSASPSSWFFLEISAASKHCFDFLTFWGTITLWSLHPGWKCWHLEVTGVLEHHVEGHSLRHTQMDQCLNQLGSTLWWWALIRSNSWESVSKGWE